MKHAQHGFTVLELIIVILVGGIISTLMFNFFNGSYVSYLKLQEDSIKFSDLSLQSQRVTKVLRGSTDVLEATANAITVYAYFTPRDNVVSKIRYYRDLTAGSLKADITPMSSAPPIGTPITAQMTTYTIIAKLHVASGTDVFEYLNSAGGSLGTVTNLRDVKGIRINLAVPPTAFATTKNTTITSEVALRNRKTNL